MALFKSIVDATHYASKPENRVEIAGVLSPANYLNQPRELLEQVLTGRFPDGLGDNRSKIRLAVCRCFGGAS